ncbi:MAG TPA: class I SAM-dependent methyltransferase [Allosphingosinicella sp.]|jgi:hypothetical protein
MNVQRTLCPEQVRAFHLDIFVTDQVRDFAAISPCTEGGITDMGGGCGYFARELARRLPSATLTVTDVDDASLAVCATLGVATIKADAFFYKPQMEECGCFNLILHHLVGGGESATRALQVGALNNWRGRHVFVNEYIYDAWIGDLAGRLIYALTSTSALSFARRAVGKLFPALNANTSGVGVRFRSRRAWERLFREAGFEVTASTRGSSEHVHWLLSPLVHEIRRDSFMLRSDHIRASPAKA